MHMYVNSGREDKQAAAIDSPFSGHTLPRMYDNPLTDGDIGNTSPRKGDIAQHKLGG
jgi:hypothetical protein